MDLKRDKRQNIQKKLDFSSERKGEARQARREETESRQAVHEPESPASTIRPMEEVCERENLLEALRRVKANKGSAGIDGMTVGQLSGYLKEHWLTIREQLLNGIYEPQPVRRVEIEKPDGGGMRKLGIPTILDRFLQQAVMQVLQRQAMQQSRDEIGRSRGVTCFSAHWHDPVIWAHYSDKHRGICLGFEVREDKAKRVNYVTERLPFPTAPPITIDHAEAMLFTKYDSWKYEQELRIWATLEEEEDGLYFKDFDDELRLVEVIVGARCTVPRSAIVRALAPLTTEISLVKARAGFTKFEIVTDQRGLK